MLKELTRMIRVAAMTADECSAHLAIHSTRDNAVRSANVSVALTQIADQIHESIIEQL